MLSCVVDQRRDALVDALVAPADERDAGMRRQRARGRLIERPAARREQDAVRRAARRRDRVERGGDRLDAHDHARARRRTGCRRPGGGCRGRSRAGSSGGRRRRRRRSPCRCMRRREQPVEHLGEQGHELERDARRFASLSVVVVVPGRRSTCILRPGVSTPMHEVGDQRESGARGRRRPTTVATSCAPFQNVPRTRPSGRPSSSLDGAADDVLDEVLAGRERRAAPNAARGPRTASAPRPRRGRRRPSKRTR